MILKTFLEHEILNLIKSSRIYLSVIMFLLLYVSIFVVRVLDYQKQTNQYLADVRQADEVMQNPDNYSHINPRAIHHTSIFSIFNQGYRFNRVINIQFYEPIDRSITFNEERNRLYLENSQIDITFLVTFFLSLFILLITYDCVNGEKRSGTLRVLMTYPFKRQSYVLKKILGAFIFVSFTFSVPYTLSLISLIVIYSNLLTGSFFLSAFFYWFLVLLFIIFFTLIGILISICSSYPNRSLVYSLFIWLLLSILLPVSWDYIISPKLFDNSLTQLQQIHTDKKNIANDLFWNPPPEVKPGGMYLMHTGSHFYNSKIFSDQNTYDTHYRFQKYLYENYYPATKVAELAIDDVIRKRLTIENTKNWIFFFNPILLFEDISRKITGNSRGDYLRFLHDGRLIRDDLVNRGIQEGWLMDYRFFAMFQDEHLFESEQMQALWQRAMKEGVGSVFLDILAFMENSEKFKFEMPTIRRYTQPNFSFSEIFGKIAIVLTIFVFSILILWILTWIKFMKYDVR